MVAILIVLLSVVMFVAGVVIGRVMERRVYRKDLETLKKSDEELRQAWNDFFHLVKGDNNGEV